jgi:hypothetical protein
MYADSCLLVVLSLHQQMQLLTTVWVWGKSLLELLELVDLVVLVVHLSLKLEFIQGIQPIV